IVGEHLIYIFDDSFSSVDHETEEGILYELKEFLHNRTCIFITHRISTLKLCNRILYLENGSISEQGGHEDLMKIKGLYYKTYLLQQALTGDRV
ncbi:MAG: ABC transporter ATP-binding protein, partial [Deltaproteobacteria bacterium]|nr:ABC transporter ATP-binding protein [Deltaproteobacteria bacterium]